MFSKVNRRSLCSDKSLELAINVSTSRHRQPQTVFEAIHSKPAFLLNTLQHTVMIIFSHSLGEKRQPRLRRAVQKSADIALVGSTSSSETQGQLVGTTGFSWAKDYNKSGRAPGHLLLPNEFQKRLKSRLLIGQKNIFLANQRRGTARRLSCLLTRGCFPHRTP